MAFHRKLTGQDLHAPSILLIENSGPQDILRGDVLIIDGYNTASKRYLVRRAQDIPLLDSPVKSAIYGIAIEQTLGPLDRGSMTAFGIAENLVVVPTADAPGDGPVTPLANSPLYVEIGELSPNVGRLVTGKFGDTVEVGIILSVTSTNVVTAFILSITAGLVNILPNSANKAIVAFDTSTFDVDMTTGERTGKLTHSTSTIDVVAQFFEYTNPLTDPLTYFGGALDVDWKPDPDDQFNTILVTLPPLALLPDFTGYMEIVY